MPVTLPLLQEALHSVYSAFLLVWCSHSSTLSTVNIANEDDPSVEALLDFEVKDNCVAAVSVQIRSNTPELEKVFHYFTGVSFQLSECR